MQTNSHKLFFPSIPSDFMEPLFLLPVSVAMMTLPHGGTTTAETMDQNERRVKTDNAVAADSSASSQEQQQQQHTEFKPISSNYHIQALENGSLTIKEVMEKDAGAYLCEAGNGVGADLSVVVRLQVHVKAHFKNNFQMIRVVRGKALKIPCDAYGKKPLHIKWSKDGMEIDSHSDPK